MGDIARLEKIYNDILWTHKIQEKQADIYCERATRWKVASIAFVTLTGSGLLTGVLSSIYAVQVASVFIAAVSLFVTIYREAMNYESKAYDCARAAMGFLSLRGRAEEAISKARIAPDNTEAIAEEMRQIANQYEALCQVAPRTSDEAVKRAEKAKSEGEFSEMELDG